MIGSCGYLCNYVGQLIASWAMCKYLRPFNWLWNRSQQEWGTRMLPLFVLMYNCAGWKRENICICLCLKIYVIIKAEIVHMFLCKQCLMWCFAPLQVKCDQYWPTRATETYGLIQVSLLDTVELATYCVRTFSLFKVRSVWIFLIFKVLDVCCKGH